MTVDRTYGMIVSMMIRCGSCDLDFERRSPRGPAPKYCSEVCRKRAQDVRSQPGYRASLDRSRAKNESQRPTRQCPICDKTIPKQFTVRKKTCGSVECARDLAAKAMREWSRKQFEATGVSYSSRFVESRRSGAARRKARMRAVEVVEVFPNREIFDRDGWVCGICELPVDSTLRAPNRDSASLDHIIPVSLGGNHTRDNVRLAHYGCNAARGNRVEAA